MTRAGTRPRRLTLWTRICCPNEKILGFGNFKWVFAERDSSMTAVSFAFFPSHDHRPSDHNASAG